jgi:hypothetical protein
MPNVLRYHRTHEISRHVDHRDRLAQERSDLDCIAGRSSLMTLMQQENNPNIARLDSVVRQILGEHHQVVR